MHTKSKKLNDVLLFFEKHKIEYVLVGENIEKLLTDINGDVDIAISKSSFIKLHYVIEELCSELDIHLIQLYRHEIDVFGTLFTWEEDGQYYYLGLDICVDYRRNGHVLIDIDTLLSNKKKNIWFTLNFEINFLYYLVKKIGKCSIDDAQISFLCDLYNKSNKGVVKTMITTYWDEDNQHEIIKYIQNKDTFSFNSKIKLWNKIMLSNSKYSLKEYFINFKRKVSYIFEPRGLICSLKESDLPFFDEYIKTTSDWFRKNQVIKLKRFTPLTILKVLNFKWHSGIVFVVSPNTNRFVFSDISLDATNSSGLKPHFDHIINYMETRETKRIKRFIKHLRQA